MSGRFSRRVDDDSENTALTQQQQERHEELHQFPFANESINPDDSNVVVDSSEQSYDRLHTRPARSLSSLSTAHLSSSYGQKTPARSFYHQSFQASLGLLISMEIKTSTYLEMVLMTTSRTTVLVSGRTRTDARTCYMGAIRPSFYQGWSYTGTTTPSIIRIGDFSPWRVYITAKRYGTAQFNRLVKAGSHT